MIGGSTKKLIWLKQLAFGDVYISTSQSVSFGDVYISISQNKAIPSILHQLNSYATTYNLLLSEQKILLEF